MKNMKIINLDNYCTDFMFPVVMMCVTYSTTILYLAMFNFPLDLRDITLFVEIYIYRF